MRRFAIPLLLCLSALLALALAWMWLTPQGHKRQFNWHAPAPKGVDFKSVLPVHAQAAAVENSRLIAMQERPAFSMTRRPPPPPPPPPVPPPVDVLSSAKVTGIYSGTGGTGVLLNLGGKSRRVRVNENVDGWVLTGIEGRSATFVSGGQTRSLPLGRATLTSAPAGVPLSATVNPPVTEPTAPSEQRPSRPRPVGPVFGGS
jgi:hypothetical protein